MMQFVVITCSIQPISHLVNSKIAPTSVKEVNEIRLSLHVGSTQARSHNEANEAVASPKISKKNLPQMKNS